jgi:glycosyltransferase involved in cell wall biosynthesis
VGDAPGSDAGPTRKVRVLWVAKGLGPGGMEQLLLTHARLGDRDRIEYLAAYVVPRPNSIVDQLEAAGVRCFALGGSDPRDPRWVARLVALVRREHVDVVHVHSPYVAALVRPALRSLPRRPAVVYTEHNSADCYGRATRWSNLATYPLDDVRYAVSSAARDSTPARLRARTEVLVHGVDVASLAERRGARAEARTALGVHEGDLVVGIVANLRAAKAYPVLLQAATRVVAAEPRARFVSMGQGPLAEEMATLRDELGLAERFRFLGFTPDPTRLMAGLDVLVLSSDVEGAPVSVMEAKALGLPVVATRVGGLPDMVDDGVDGLLVPRRDPDALARALLRVLGDDGLRASMAAASAASAVRYDASVAIGREDARYLELAGRRS